MERHILAVCKDPGGMSGVVPVVRMLREKHPVILIGNGKAAELLPKGEDEFEVYQTAEQVIASHPNPLLLLTSMCSEGGVGRDLVPVLEDTCPIIALSDYWGTRLVDSWKDPQYRPDYMCVNDELGVSLNKKAWPDFEGSVITGYPMFDRYADFQERQQEAAHQVRAKLGLKAGIPIVLFPCGINRRPGELLGEVVSALESCEQLSYFVPRMHPRTPPEEASLWYKTLAQYTKEGVIADSSVCDTSSMVLASKLVISDFSTVLVEAALCRKTAISVFYPECVRELFTREFGMLMSEPPVTMLGSAARATDSGNLGTLVAQALSQNQDTDPLGLYENQVRNFSTDGRNAERVASFVESRLS